MEYSMGWCCCLSRGALVVVLLRSSRLFCSVNGGDQVRHRHRIAGRLSHRNASRLGEGRLASQSLDGIIINDDGLDGTWASHAHARPMPCHAIHPSPRARGQPARPASGSHKPARLAPVSLATNSEL